MPQPKETDLELKGLAEFEIKDADKGQVQAVVATLNVVDKDEDIIRSDAIQDGAKVKVSGYGHSAVFGEAPVGKGTLHKEGERIVFKGQYFLDTTAGLEAFNVVKALGSDSEWSFGFRVLGAEVPTDEERQKGARRILTKLAPFEVSPVIMGAGVGTGTVSAKSETPTPPPPDPEAEKVAADLAEACASAARRFRRKPF